MLALKILSRITTRVIVHVKIKYIPIILLFSLIASSMEMDVSVPGFPAMAEYFNTNEASIQATLSLNLLGFCLSALLFGPLADSFGRKKIMVAGFFLFGICSIGCAITEQLSWLLSFRFLQGLGASSIWVVAYAIVADVYQGPAAVRFMGLLNAVVTAVMAIAPALGSLMCARWGWKSTYFLIAVLSMMSFVMLALFLPETNHTQKPLKFRSIMRDYTTLLKSYDFMVHALAPSLLSMAYMAYIASASFLYIDRLHMSFNEYAVHQSCVIATFSLASFKSDWLLNKIGDSKAQQLGLIFSILGMAFITPLSIFYPTSAIVITACMTLFSAGVAICFGIVVAKTMEFYPDLKGTASSLMMAIRVSFCSLGVLIGAEMYTGRLVDSAATIACLAVSGIVANILTLRYSQRMVLNQV